jgi:hypothetical protein
MLRACNDVDDKNPRKCVWIAPSESESPTESKPSVMSLESVYDTVIAEPLSMIWMMLNSYLFFWCI